MQIRLIHFFTALALATSAPLAYSAGNDFSDVKAQVTKQHDEAVKRLQDWIKQVSIAAEDRGYPEGADYMVAARSRMLGSSVRNASRPTASRACFATLDAGAPKTIGIYFMYDVKQVDPSEWIPRPGMPQSSTGRSAKS